MKMDHLGEIVQNHILKASTEGVNLKDVVEAILVDYMRHLYGQGVHIPGNVQPVFLADMREEIYETIARQTNTSSGNIIMAEQNLFVQALRKVS